MVALVGIRTMTDIVCEAISQSEQRVEHSIAEEFRRGPEEPGALEAIYVGPVLVNFRQLQVADFHHVKYTLDWQY